LLELIVEEKHWRKLEERKQRTEMNSMLEDFPCRNVQNFSKAKINSAPERASKSPETVSFIYFHRKLNQ